MTYDYQDGTQPRAYVAAHFSLELDGKKDVGLFRSIEGGGVKADVMTYQMGQNYDRWRSIGKQKYEDIKMQVGMAMSAPFYDWISNFFTGKPVRKNGVIVAADFQYKERARREFTEALIKEITFPKLDSEDKNPAYMNIGITVEDMVFKKGTGVKLEPPKGMDEQKFWTSNNFDFRFDGLEKACERITKIDAFTIKQNILEYHSGGRTSPTKTPTGVEFPQLVIYVPEVDAQPFFEHFTNYGMKHKRDQRKHGAKKTGEIKTYDNSGKALFTLEYFEAEIVSITPDKSDAGTDAIKQVKIEIFTESMVFKYS